MTREEFYKKIQEEKLDKIPVDLSSEMSTAKDVFGYLLKDGRHIVYYIDSKSSLQILSEHESENEALEILFEQLKNFRKNN